MSSQAKWRSRHQTLSRDYIRNGYRLLTDHQLEHRRVLDLRPEIDLLHAINSPQGVEGILDNGGGVAISDVCTRLEREQRNLGCGHGGCGR